MRRRRETDSNRDATAASPDLTPLVDVTFQLLVFLLVVNDITARQNEELVLPEAQHATELRPDDATCTVNVLAPTDPADDAAPPRVRVSGRTLDLPDLVDTLRAFADRERDGREPRAPSASAVLIRADAGAPWRHVQLVMQACVDDDVRIVRVQFATRGPATEPSREEARR